MSNAWMRLPLVHNAGGGDKDKGKDKKKFITKEEEPGQ
jgi:hypothetical protein